MSAAPSVPSFSWWGRFFKASLKVRNRVNTPSETTPLWRAHSRPSWSALGFAQRRVVPRTPRRHHYARGRRGQPGPSFRGGESCQRMIEPGERRKTRTSQDCLGVGGEDISSSPRGGRALLHSPPLVRAGFTHAEAPLGWDLSRIPADHVLRFTTFPVPSPPHSK